MSVLKFVTWDSNSVLHLIMCCYKKRNAWIGLNWTEHTPYPSLLANLDRRLMKRSIRLRHGLQSRIFPLFYFILQDLACKIRHELDLNIIKEITFFFFHPAMAKMLCSKEEMGFNHPNPRDSSYLSLFQNSHYHSSIFSLISISTVPEPSHQREWWLFF